MCNLNQIFSYKLLKYNLLLEPENRFNKLVFFFKWYFSKQRLQSISRTEKFRNIHLDKRCFIIGNGPSLNRMDLLPLKDEYTFGLNRIYLLFPKLGFSTTYYVAINQLILEQFNNEISDLKIPKFLNCRAIDHIPFDSDTIFMKTIGGPPQFSYDPGELVWESGTVTYAAIQIAYFMGFKEIILIGVDHNFNTKGPANTTVTSQTDDLNHFAPNYFGKGVKWQLPDLYSSELGYNLARDIFNKENRSILDATVDGKLDIFPKIDYHSLF